MIFISHKTSTEHDLALGIARMLHENGISCWIAPENVEAGEDFAPAIVEAINSCEIFLLIFTGESMASEHVRKEVGLATDLGKKIIALKIGDFDLNALYRYYLNGVQTIPFDFSDEEDKQRLLERCRNGEPVIELELSANPSRKIVLMKGDYQKNIDRMIHERPDEVGHTIFAMGIDATFDLSISTEQGIIRDVCKYLGEVHGIGMDRLQELVNEAAQSQLGRVFPFGELEYKDIAMIKVPIRGDSGRPLELNLLLVVNSRKNEKYYENHDINEVEGIDSREIIISIFNKVSTLPDFTNLFIGAVGTNGQDFPYEVIVTEIINSCAYAMRSGRNPLDLYFSIRKADMERKGVSIDDILNYVSATVRFYRDRRKLL